MISHPLSRSRSGVVDQGPVCRARGKARRTSARHFPRVGHRPAVHGFTPCGLHAAALFCASKASIVAVAIGARDFVKRPFGAPVQVIRLSSMGGTGRQTTQQPLGTGEGPDEKLAAYKQRTNAHTDKRHLAHFIEQTTHPTDWSCVTTALLELGFERQLDLHGKKDGSLTGPDYCPICAAAREAGKPIARRSRRCSSRQLRPHRRRSARLRRSATNATLRADAIA
jgi:hypothetical protein